MWVLPFGTQPAGLHSILECDKALWPKTVTLFQFCNGSPATGLYHTLKLSVALRAGYQTAKPTYSSTADSDLHDNSFLSVYLLKAFVLSLDPADYYFRTFFIIHFDWFKNSGASHSILLFDFNNHWLHICQIK